MSGSATGCCMGRIRRSTCGSALRTLRLDAGLTQPQAASAEIDRDVASVSVRTELSAMTCRFTLWRLCLPEENARS